MSVDTKLFFYKYINKIRRNCFYVRCKDNEKDIVI